MPVKTGIQSRVSWIPAPAAMIVLTDKTFGNMYISRYQHLLNTPPMSEFYFTNFRTLVETLSVLRQQ